MQRLPPSRPCDLALLDDTAALSDLVLDPALEHYGESGAEFGLDDDPGDGLDDLRAGDSACTLRCRPSAPA